MAKGERELVALAMVFVGGRRQAGLATSSDSEGPQVAGTRRAKTSSWKSGGKVEHEVEVEERCHMKPSQIANRSATSQFQSRSRELRDAKEWFQRNRLVLESKEEKKSQTTSTAG